MFIPRPPRQNSSVNSSPKAALLTLRIIWAALLMGQFFFMLVMAIIFTQPAPANQPPPDARVLQILYLVNAIMLVTVIPVVGFVRHAMFKAKRVNGLLPPPTYSTGCIIFWAGCEGVSFFGLVIALLHRSFWPTIVIVAIAIAIQIVTFPRKSAIIAPDETFKIG